MHTHTHTHTHTRTHIHDTLGTRGSARGGKVALTCTYHPILYKNNSFSISCQTRIKVIMSDNLSESGPERSKCHTLGTPSRLFSTETLASRRAYAQRLLQGAVYSRASSAKHPSSWTVTQARRQSRWNHLLEPPFSSSPPADSHDRPSTVTVVYTHTYIARHTDS